MILFLLAHTPARAVATPVPSHEMACEYFPHQARILQLADQFQDFKPALSYATQNVATANTSTTNGTSQPTRIILNCKYTISTIRHAERLTVYLAALPPTNYQVNDQDFSLRGK
jgi:hypothetical protein